MAAGDLTTLSAAQAWLGQSSDPNGFIAALVSAVSSEIQNFVSYQFAAASYAQTFDGKGQTRLMLPEIPVTAVASVSIDGQAIPPAPDAVSPGFVFDARSVSLRGYRFNRGVQNVSVAYTAGYAAIPPDIQQACLDWIKVAWERRNSPANVSVLRAGDTEMRFGSEFSTVRNQLLGAMPPAVFAALQPYARSYPA